MIDHSPDQLPDPDDDLPFNLKALENLPFVGQFFKRGPKIPVIRLAGIIADGSMKRGGLSYARVSKAIEKAFSISKAPAVALIINSPGGTPAQSQLIAGLIRSLADEKDITVYAFVEDVAASGGYWLACAADHIYVQETSIIGSIGVITAGFGLEDFIDRHGIKRRLYTSGRDKSMLDPFSPEKPADVTRLREIQRQIHDHFIEWVKDRRGGKLNGSDEDLFEGRFWTGATALEAGIADEIGNIRSVMREKYGEDIRLIPINPDRKCPIPFLGAKAQINENWADDLMAMAEDRSLWAQFGF